MNQSMTPEEAKAASHAVLVARGLLINESLPLIEAIGELRPQSADAVARRSMILGCVIATTAYGANLVHYRDYLDATGLLSAASTRERDLLTRDTHSAQEKINATWMAECVQALAWCIKLTDHIDPLRPCENELATLFPRPFNDPAPFVQSAKLRPFDEIYAQADLHYRLHWAARNARLMGTQSSLDEGIVMERRKALDWVIGVEADWDEVPGNT